MCFHEGAHIWYRKVVGAVNIQFMGPCFSYHAATNEVGTASAGITSDFSRFVSFRDMAKYCVAGYLWEAALVNAPEDPKAAAIDRQVFGEDVRRYYPADAPPVTEEQIEATWRWAEEEVRKDLTNARIRAEILILAKKFNRWFCRRLKQQFPPS
jgi:hypothetical protein